MRSEDEIYDLINDIANNDERIRAVYMNGSRTNPNVPKDIFQDYDVVFVVTETLTFIKDKCWINIFGDILIVQKPDKLDKDIGKDKNFNRTYAYLMLFTDGNRIDLRLQTKEEMLDEYGNDKLTVPLMDKDDILPLIPLPTEIDYHIKKPTKGHFESCTSNFWWCLQNVAKGIWRDELPYAKSMYEHTVRESLDNMVNWWIGIEQNFEVSTGKFGKYYKRYHHQSYWAMYQETYSNSDYTQIWHSIFTSCDLFRILSRDVAAHFNFTYPIKDDYHITQYLSHIQKLPADAQRIY